MSTQVITRRRENSDKITVIWAAGVLEMLFGSASLALGLAAGQPHPQRLVQGASIVIFLSGVTGVVLYRATYTAADCSSAVVGFVSTIVGIVAFVMEDEDLCSTQLGFYVAIQLTLLYGTIASLVRASRSTAAILGALILNYVQVRSHRSGPQTTVEVDVLPAGRCSIVDWLPSFANRNGTQTRIKYMTHDEESKIGQKPGADAAATCDLITHVTATYNPQPPRYGDISDLHSRASEKV